MLAENITHYLILKLSEEHGYADRELVHYIMLSTIHNSQQFWGGFLRLWFIILYRLNKLHAKGQLLIQTLWH